MPEARGEGREEQVRRTSRWLQLRQSPGWLSEAVYMLLSYVNKHLV